MTENSAILVRGSPAHPFDYSDLIERIYEAAVLPDLWPSVLDRIAAAAGMIGGMLFTVDPAQKLRYAISPALSELTKAFHRDGWMQQNSRAARLAPKNHPGFVSDLDLFTLEEMNQDPFYTELLRPHGVGWGAGTIILAPTEDVLVFSVEGDHGPMSRETIDALDFLRPHLARSALLSARLHLERAKSAIDALELLGIPACVLREDGRFVFANAEFQGVGPQFVLRTANRVRPTSTAAKELFLKALAEMDSEHDKAVVRSIPIPRVGDHLPAIIHLLPVRRAARELFAPGLAIMIVTSLCAPSAPDSTLLHGLFDLTPAQVRIATLVGMGFAPREISAKLGITVETVRTTLKQVFSKVGVSRQTELALKLTNLSLR